MPRYAELALGRLKAQLYTRKSIFECGDGEIKAIVQEFVKEDLEIQIEVIQKIADDMKRIKEERF